MEDRIAIEKFSNAQESLVVQQSDFSLRTVAEMVGNNTIDLTPHYQRRDRWELSKQSALIESFILNVPVPPVYLSEEDYGIYSVIDGKQRITAITNYLNNEFRLKNLQNFPELDGLLFSELPQKIRNALSIRPYIRIVTLLRQSDPNLKYEVFLRLNTGGEKLKPQEIRNVAYSGSLNNLLYELSENIFLKRKLKITSYKSPAYRNMEDLELILRYFTLMENWEKIGGVLSTEMDHYMASHRNINERELNRLRQSFETSIDACERIWGTHAFNKPVNNTWRAQLISPLFDAEMVAVSMLSGVLRNNLFDRGTIVKNKTKELFANDESFARAVSQATNNPRNIKERISKMYVLLKDVART